MIVAKLKLMKMTTNSTKVFRKFREHFRTNLPYTTGKNYSIGKYWKKQIQFGLMDGKIVL